VDREENRLTRPLQNRVTPFGEIIADPFRGALMGNRGGRIHDPETKKLKTSRWKSKQWISCVLDFKGRYREMMSGGYTALFFFDEPCALAAGHRPCFECRRADSVRFAQAWADGAGLAKPPRAPAMDAMLHQERLENKTKRCWLRDVGDLPAGVMIAIDRTAYLIAADEMRPWSPAGYGRPIQRLTGPAIVLTPPSMVAALRAGYQLSSHAGHTREIWPAPER